MTTIIVLDIFQSIKKRFHDCSPEFPHPSGMRGYILRRLYFHRKIFKVTNLSANAVVKRCQCLLGCTKKYFLLVFESALSMFAQF